MAVTSQDIDNPSGCDAQSLTYPLSPSIRFADLNGDGRAEYLYVDPDGEVTAYLNLGGPDNGPNAAKVAWRTYSILLLLKKKGWADVFDPQCRKAKSPQVLELLETRYISQI